MRQRHLGLVVAGLVAPACSSGLQSAARLYAGAGKNELATYYLAGHYRATGNAEDAKADLVRGIEAALASLDAAYDEAKSEGRHRHALAVATRKESVVSFARALGLGEFAAVDGSRLVDEAMPLAAKQALQAVDAAESGGEPAQQRVTLLRVALALDPHNSELASRYERLRGGVQLNIVPRTDCSDRFAEDCRLVAERLLAKLTEERRELTRIVPEGAGRETAQLVVHVSWSGNDTGWQRVKSGKAKTQIDKLNRFREPKKNAKGKVEKETVEASYQLHQRTSQATVNVRVEVQDLGPKKTNLFTATKTETANDQRSYVAWTGDERALGAIASTGTDQSPPAPPEQLARTAALKLADAFAAQVLAQLERGGK